MGQPARLPTEAAHASISQQPTQFHLQVKYFDQTAKERAAWAQIYEPMVKLACYVEDVLTLIPMRNAGSARGKIFFSLERASRLADRYRFRGFGYYHETMPMDHGAGIPLAWGIEVLSKGQGLRLAELVRKRRLPFDVTQYGLGATMTFGMNLLVQHGEVLAQPADVHFGDVRIAWVDLQVVNSNAVGWRSATPSPQVNITVGGDLRTSGHLVAGSGQASGNASDIRIKGGAPPSRPSKRK